MSMPQHRVCASARASAQVPPLLRPLALGHSRERQPPCWPCGWRRTAPRSGWARSPAGHRQAEQAPTRRGADADPPRSFGRTAGKTRPRRLVQHPRASAVQTPARRGRRRAWPTRCRRPFCRATHRAGMPDAACVRARSSSRRARPPPVSPPSTRTHRRSRSAQQFASPTPGRSKTRPVQQRGAPPYSIRESRRQPNSRSYPATSRRAPTRSQLIRSSNRPRAASPRARRFSGASKRPSIAAANPSAVISGA